MSTADYPVWLAVLPDQREAVRADAGRHPDGGNAITWDKKAELWYARPGADLSRLQKWLPDRSIRSSGGGDPQSEFLDALTSGGLVLDGLPVMDGQRHRVPVADGKKGNKDGVYRGFLDGIKPGGWFINYHRAENDKDITRWKASSSGTGEADPLARVHIRAVMRQSQDDFAREQAALYAQQTAKAKALYERLPAADPAHGYLVRKGVTVADDVRQTRNGALVVPFSDAEGAFRTLQYIPPDGEKYLFKDAPKAGHFRVEGGELRNGEPVLYAEGYATARSLHMVTGRPVVMTIDAGNMEAVAGVLKARYPDSPHLFMADVDHAKDVNKGVLSANRAAAATGGAVLLPDLTAAEIERGFTDFNDLHQFRGAERLRDTLLPYIAQALEQLNHKDTPMATPDDAQSAPDIPAASSPDASPARRPGAAKEKTDEILKIRDEGLNPVQIAEQLGIGQTSVYGILKAQQPEAAASSVTPETAATDVPASRINDSTAAPTATERETITLYHGSPATFSAIDAEKIGAGQNFVGRGFYTDTSVTGVHYAMEEINHKDYHVYELEIPTGSVILDRWDSSSLTDELRERIREAGKTIDQQRAAQGDTSRSGRGDLLASCEKIDATFFMHAGSPEGMHILKEAGIDALKDNSYIAIVNTDLIENVRLRSAEGAARTEMTQYIEKASGNAAQDAARLSGILQEKPDVAVYYDAIRSELLSLVRTQNKSEESERLTALLSHALVETIDNTPDRKTAITPLNRLYAEAIRSLDLKNDESAATLGHLIDSAVISTNPDQKTVAEPAKPEPAAAEPVAAVQDSPAPEAQPAPAAPAAAPVVADVAAPVVQPEKTVTPDAPSAIPEPAALVQDAPESEASRATLVVAAEVTPAAELAMAEPAAAVATSAPAPNVSDVLRSEAPPAPPAGAKQPAAVSATTGTTAAADFSTEFADINNRLRALKDEAAGLDTDVLAMRTGALINERIALTEMWAQGNTTENARWPSDESEALESELRAELDQRPDTSPSPTAAAFGEENAILVGASRVAPQDEDPPAASGPASSRIDADKLLSRVTHEKHPDGKSVLYKLDGEPAFIDRGNRLVMAEGTSAHEEKVLAALLTAANHYQGRIELTGSDEFKAFAIGVIVANKLDVSMKNASQQADLDAARRAAGQPVTQAAPVDTVRGDPQASRATDAPSSAPTALAQQKAEPVTVSPHPAPSEPASPRVSGAVHTPAEKAREPVTGKVTACGQAPFRFEADASESTFITLRTKEGSQTFWGKELAGLLRESNLQPGRMVTLQWLGEQPVTVKVPQKNEQGQVTHYKNVDTHRNQWSLAPAGGARVQTGGNELVPLSAVDVNRYQQIQQVLVSRLGLDIHTPPKPADGLYWMKPDGQGSSIAGDALSAPRPEHNDRAGTAVMSAWGDDGRPDLYLVQGDGHYLQGVVRHEGAYQHVLVSLPDIKESPPMVINLLTPDGAKPIGSGNGINKSNGQPVPRENVVIRLTGDEQQRIAKLDAPADMPASLHARLGYDERYKAESGWVKDQPAAAPQAAPVTPPRPAQ